MLIQYRAFGRKLTGYCAYYGIRGNAKQLRCMRYRVEQAWIKWLSRRSQRAKLDWVQTSRLLARYPLPSARLVASDVV